MNTKTKNTLLNAAFYLAAIAIAAIAISLAVRNQWFGSVKLNMLQKTFIVTAVIAVIMVFFSPKSKTAGQTNPIIFAVISACVYAIVSFLLAATVHYLILMSHTSRHADTVLILLVLGFLATGIFFLTPTKVGPAPKDAKKADEGDGKKDDDSNVLYVATVLIFGQPIPGLVISQGWTLIIKGIMSLSLIKADWDNLTSEVEMISADNAPFKCEVSFRYKIKDFYVAIFENGIGTVTQTLQDTVEACLTVFARSVPAEVLTRLDIHDKTEFLRDYLIPDLNDAADRLGITIETVSKKGSIVVRLDDFSCTDPSFQAALLQTAVTQRAMESVRIRMAEFKKLYHEMHAVYSKSMKSEDAASKARDDAMVQLGLADKHIFAGVSGNTMIETGDGIIAGGGGKGNNKSKKKKK
jgi:regulator of protease activity HflC (stomatin/prohibitin superfamily)